MVFERKWEGNFKEHGKKVMVRAICDGKELIDLLRLKKTVKGLANQMKSDGTNMYWEGMIIMFRGVSLDLKAQEKARMTKYLEVA